MAPSPPSTIHSGTNCTRILTDKWEVILPLIENIFDTPFQNDLRPI